MAALRSCPRDHRSSSHCGSSTRMKHILVSVPSVSNGQRGELPWQGSCAGFTMHCFSAGHSAGRAGCLAMGEFRSPRGGMKASYLALLASALLCTVVPDSQAQRIKVIIDQDARGPATTDMQSIL